MPSTWITIACPSCATSLKVKEEMAGKRVKCPRCHKIVLVAPSSPEPAGLPESAERTETQALGAVDSSPSDATHSGQQPPPRKAGLDFLSPAQSADELGRLGPFRVLEVLGEGGMGLVLRAEDPALGRLVALKVIRPALADTEGVRERFLREARAVAAIEDDHVVAIFHVGEEGGVPYLTMPLLQGESLDSRLKREGRLAIPEVLRIGREMALGLAAAHEKGLIHRDIKPANLWLEGQRGRVKLLDFGLARGLEGGEPLTQSGLIVGTPSYMSPEQGRGEPLDARSDLFSLGSVLYRMCTGRPPFTGSDPLSTLLAVTVHQPAAPHEVAPEVPLELSLLVLRLLAKQREGRPQSAQEVAEALQRLEEQLPAPAAGRGSESTPIQEAARPRGRGGRRRLLAGTLACLGALALLLGLLWSPWGTRPGVGPEEQEVAVGEPGSGAPAGPPARDGGPGGQGPEQPKPPPAGPKDGPGEGKPPPQPHLDPGGKPGGDPAGPPGGVTPKGTYTNSIGMEFVLVPKGTFWMGECDYPNVKNAVKQVEIPEDFYIGKYEVTQEQWQAVMGSNPSYFSRTGEGKDKVKDIPDEELKRFPVEKVSWDDVQEFLRKLNEKEQGGEWVYRLPSEAEWEYTCRGGATSKEACSFDFYLAQPSESISPEQANFFDSRLGRPARVGSYQPNALGVYDMHGNVWEWCQDLYSTGPSLRVPRGGGWNLSGPNCRAAARRGCMPSNRLDSHGFRITRVPSGK